MVFNGVISKLYSHVLVATFKHRFLLKNCHYEGIIGKAFGYVDWFVDIEAKVTKIFN